MNKKTILIGIDLQDRFLPSKKDIDINYIQESEEDLIFDSQKHIRITKNTGGRVVWICFGDKQIDRVSGAFSSTSDDLLFYKSHTGINDENPEDQKFIQFLNTLSSEECILKIWGLNTSVCVLRTISSILEKTQHSIELLLNLSRNYNTSALGDDQAFIEWNRTKNIQGAYHKYLGTEKSQRVKFLGNSYTDNL